jgi:Neurotransmitter-gated ion-channel ligand binding domain
MIFLHMSLTLNHLICLIFLLVFISSSQFDVSVRAHENATEIRRIHVPPEKRPPSFNHNPVTIEFSIFVVDINSINVEDMDFRVDMFVHQKWVETRLTITDDLFEEGDDYITLPPEYFENLWQPDPYFINSKVAGNFVAVFDPFMPQFHANFISLFLITL